MKTPQFPAFALPAIACIGLLLLTLPAATRAQPAPLPATARQPSAAEAAMQDAARKQDWDIRVGVGALYQPEYEGSDEFKIVPLPLLLVNYRDLVFLRGPMLGANVFTWRGPRPGDKLQAGPLLRYQFGRDEGDSDDLRGMGDIDGGVEAGGFITYGIGAWSTGLTVFRGLGDTHDGLTAKFSAGHRLPLGPKLMLRSEISATWADDNYTQTFFGVSAVQAARSGLVQYRPEAGFKDAGITFDLDYRLTEHWGVTGRLGYKRLLGDAAASPLVEDRGSANQFSTGLSLSYRF